MEALFDGVAPGTTPELGGVLADGIVKDTDCWLINWDCPLIVEKILSGVCNWFVIICW